MIWGFVTIVLDALRRTRSQRSGDIVIGRIQRRSGSSRPSTCEHLDSDRESLVGAFGKAGF